MGQPVTKQKANELNDIELDNALAMYQDGFLNEKQFQFVELVSFGEQPHKAAKLAGYKNLGGLLKNSRILDALELMRVRSSRYAKTTREWRRMALKKSYDRLESIANQSQEDGNLSIAIKAEAGLQNTVKILNDMDQESQIRLTLEHGVNSMIASLDISLVTDEELLSKLFHIVSLNDEKLINQNVIEHEE